MLTDFYQTTMRSPYHSVLICFTHLENPHFFDSALIAGGWGGSG